jgi:hypothetical protein
VGGRLVAIYLLAYYVVNVLSIDTNVANNANNVDDVDNANNADLAKTLLPTVII